MPLTASSPMLPPGKKSGRTTNESVEKARRAPASVSTAASPSAGEYRVGEGGHEEMLDQVRRELAAAAVPHDDVGVVAQRKGTGPAGESIGEALSGVAESEGIGNSMQVDRLRTLRGGLRRAQPEG